MNYSIRPINPSDFSQLIDLFSEFAAFEKMPEKMTNTVEKMQNENDFFHGFVAETADHTIVGYATFFFCYYTWTGKSLYMDDLYVRPQYRACGIGSHLIKAIIELARNAGCHKMRWQVSGWNQPAIDFYTQLGAEIDDSEHNCDLKL